MEAAFNSLISQGPAWALLVVALVAIGFLFKANQALHAQSREDGRESVKALIETTEAIRQMTKVIEQNTQVSQALIGGKR